VHQTINREIFGKLEIEMCFFNQFNVKVNL